MFSTLTFTQTTLCQSCSGAGGYYATLYFIKREWRPCCWCKGSGLIKRSIEV